MTKQELHNRMHLYLASCVAFCLPINKLTPVFIALLTLNWLFEGGFSAKFKRLLEQRVVVLFIAFYTLLMFGMLYTDNVKAGLFDLQVKATLVLLPIIFATKPIRVGEQRFVLSAFVSGIVLSSLFMLVNAINTYYTLSVNHFFYLEFSSFIHPSYLSLYVNFALAWMIYLVLTKPVFKKPLYILLFLVLVCFLILINVLLSSKMGLFTMGLLFIGMSIYYAVVSRKYYLALLAIASVFTLFYLIVQLAPDVAGRITRAITAVEDNNAQSQSASESTSVRILVWNASRNIIKKHFLVGVGTGDVKDELMKEYKKLGMSSAAEHHLNAHNQFYQIFICLGLLGFCCFLACIGIPVWHAWKGHDIVYLSFLLLMVFNFMAESMLETQAGVLFYAFFNALLLFASRKEDKPIIS